MNRYQKWAEREHSPASRAAALVGLGIFFTGILPFLLVVASYSLDRWLGLPRLTHRVASPIVALALTLPGLGLALWTIYEQVTRGRGTPAPMMPTQELITGGPFRYCRNPMTLGTAVAFTGLCVWIGSLSALVIVLALTALLLTYIHNTEEKELAARFGPAYEEYRKRTPFIIPRLR
jgi:protein-S-isoprenylcysteine O-methyltransferase Ste14